MELPPTCPAKQASITISRPPCPHGSFPSPPSSVRSPSPNVIPRIVQIGFRNRRSGKDINFDQRIYFVFAFRIQKLPGTIWILAECKNKLATKISTAAVRKGLTPVGKENRLTDLDDAKFLCCLLVFSWNVWFVHNPIARIQQVCVKYQSIRAWNRSTKPGKAAIGWDLGNWCSDDKSLPSSDHLLQCFPLGCARRS